MLALLVAGAAACVGPLGRAFAGGLIEDHLAVFAKVVIYAASAVAIPLGDRWFAKRGVIRFEYPILVIIAALGMGMMVSAGDLITLYISIELHSLALYILAAFLNNLPSGALDAPRPQANRRKPDLSISSWAPYPPASSSTARRWFTASRDPPGSIRSRRRWRMGPAAAAPCSASSSSSAASASRSRPRPFHMWTPDVYEGAPTPVVGFFAGAPKIAAMVLLARLLSDAFGGAVHDWRQILVAMALISVAVGAFAGLAQKDIQRLWAYSSIANIGYALVGLAAGGPIGVQSMLVFMTLYVVDVTGVFACLTALSRGGRPLRTFDDFAGLAKERPGLALAMSFFSLSALGMPPFSGLWSKYYVFKAALSNGLAPVAVLALVGSVVAAFYYLKLIRRMWFDAAVGPTDPPARGAAYVAYAAALFAFPGVLIALIWIDPARETGLPLVGDALNTLTRRGFGGAVTAAAALSAVTANASSAEADQFRSLYTEEWAWRLAQFPDDEDPERAIAPYLPDASMGAQAARLAKWRDVQTKLAAIDRSRLSPDEQVDYLVYKHQIDSLEASQAFRDYEAPFNSDSSVLGRSDGPLLSAFPPRGGLPRLHRPDASATVLFRRADRAYASGSCPGLHAAEGHTDRPRRLGDIDRRRQDAPGHDLLETVRRDAGLHPAGGGRRTQA